MDTLFKDSDVEKLASGVWDRLHEKIKDDITGVFYNDIQNYLYEHYNNASDGIKDKLVAYITEEFVNCPDEYRFAKLRKRLFNENADLLIDKLTDEAILEKVENIIMDYSHRNDHFFKWQWQDGVAKIVFKNADKLLEHSRVQRDLLHKIENLKRANEYLREQLWYEKPQYNY